MGSSYIVSWCFGHLAELAEAAAYDEKYAKWRSDLPILPESWQYSVARDKADSLPCQRAHAPENVARSSMLAMPGARANPSSARSICSTNATSP